MNGLWKGNKFCNPVSFIVKSGVYNMRHFAVIVFVEEVKTALMEGDIGFFGFPVLVIFEIGFSVFDLKIFRFSVLVPTAVFGFSLF